MQKNETKSETKNKKNDNQQSISPTNLTTQRTHGKKKKINKNIITCVQVRNQFKRKTSPTLAE